MCRNTDIEPQPVVVKLCGRGLDVYRRVLAEGPSGGEVPECLTELGLLRPHSEDPARWIAVPAGVAASELIRPIERSVLTQQHAMAAILDSVSAAEDVYQAEHRSSAASTRLLHGADVINAALRQANESCREELLTARPGAVTEAERIADSLPRTLLLNQRGARQRTLYQHAVRTHGPTLAYIEQVTAAGAQVRTLDEVFDRLIIYDRTIAFIPDPRYDVSVTALAIEHPAIVHYLAKVFEHSWQRAQPVSITQEYSRPPLLTGETRRAVLQLMVEGHTDATISKRLGISTRTVSSHVSKTSETMHARSRAHLAYLLARSELV